MRKKNYRITRIPKGEDTPCKECDVYLNNGVCTGNCRLIRRWRWIDGKGYKGYIYKSKNYIIIKGTKNQINDYLQIGEK